MFKTVIVDSGYQIKAQTEAFAPIPIPFCQNPKDLQTSDNMLNDNSRAIDFTIPKLCFFGQLAAFGFLLRRSRVRMQFLQSVITFITEFCNFFCQLNLALFVKFEIVNRAGRMCRCHNLFRLYISDDLRVESMPLFLAGVVSLLFFFGRSIGVSPTSTTTTSKAKSFSLRTFLPGSRNSGQSFKISSTRWVIRQTVLSDKP